MPDDIVLFINTQGYHIIEVDDPTVDRELDRMRDGTSVFKFGHFAYIVSDDALVHLKIIFPNKIISVT